MDSESRAGARRAHRRGPATGSRAASLEDAGLGLGLRALYVGRRWRAEVRIDVLGVALAVQPVHVYHALAELPCVVARVGERLHPGRMLRQPCDISLVANDPVVARQ